MFESHRTHWLERQTKTFDAAQTKLFSSNSLFQRKLSFLLPIKISRFKNMAVRYSFQRSRPKWLVPVIETCVCAVCADVCTFISDSLTQRGHFPPIGTNSNEMKQKKSFRNTKKPTKKKNKVVACSLAVSRNDSITTELFIVSPASAPWNSGDWTSVH